MRSALIASLLLGWTLAASAEDWPEFRGPTGQGLSAAKGLPLEWDPTKNVAWKQDIPGAGWSSPIVWQDRVYLTTAVPMPNKDDEDQSLRALCLDAQTGRILWDHEVFRQDAATAPGIHNKNSHASPTSLTDGQRLYVHFGHQGTAALDFDGKILWTNRMLKYRPVHGNGGSPVLVDDLLVFSEDGSNQQLVVALDRATGQLRWKTPRKTESFKKFAFSTPLVITVNGKQQIISPGAGLVGAYDPATGQEIWRVRYGEGYSVVPRPVFGHGLVFLSSGYDSAQLLAIRTDGQGDVTDTHVAWTLKRGAPHSPSPLLVGDELYIVSDLGIATCLDARTGREHWRERLGGEYSASPLYADGRIYFQSEKGAAVVVKPGQEFAVLAKNDLGERSLASYAVADGALFIRTDKHLFRIQER